MSYLYTIFFFVFIALLILWPVILLGFLSFFVYKKFKKRKTINRQALFYAFSFALLVVGAFTVYMAFYRILPFLYNPQVAFEIVGLSYAAAPLALIALLIGWSVSMLALVALRKKKKEKGIERWHVVVPLIILTGFAVLYFTLDRSESLSIQVSDATTQEEVMELYELDWTKRDSNVLTQIARHEKTPVDLLVELSQHKSEEVRRAVASNRNTPEEVLSELGTDEDRDVRWSVAYNPNTLPEILTMLYHKETQVYGALASNPSTPTDILWDLVEVKGSSISSVAENPSTPVELLIILSEDDFFFTRCGVAKNPNTPVEVLVELSRDSEASVRNCVAQNPNTPEDFLMKLVDDVNIRVSNSAKETLSQKDIE